MFSDSSVKQEYVIRNVAQLGNIIPVANQTVCCYYILLCVSAEAEIINQSHSLLVDSTED
jgi:hypothetical protein